MRLVRDVERLEFCLFLGIPRLGQLVSSPVDLGREITRTRPSLQ